MCAYYLIISKQVELNVVLNQIKYLMKNIRDICDNLNDKTEIAIIERYGNNANRYPVAFLSKIIMYATHKQLFYETLKFYTRECIFL